MPTPSIPSVPFDSPSSSVSDLPARLVSLHWSNIALRILTEELSLSYQIREKVKSACCNVMLDRVIEIQKARQKVIGGEIRPNTKEEGKTHINSSFLCSSLVRCCHLMMYAVHFEIGLQM